MGFTDTNGVYHAFHGELHLSLNDFREVDTNTAVANIVGNGGILASDTTPVLGGTTNKSQQISWAASNSDIVALQKALPNDFDGTQDVLLELWVNSGTTDLASFTAKTSWNDGAQVSTTVTDSGASATTHKISAVIPNASIPDRPSFLTLTLTPAAHTTNAIVLVAARLSYVPRANL